MPSLRSNHLFFRQFISNFKSTGALAPSSRFLAQALAAYVRKEPSTPARRILEVGPGTGSVTRAILKSLRPGDHLTLVEVNKAFVDHLQDKLDRDALFAAARDRVRIVHGRFEELGADEPFDVIVSGLPLNNFAPRDIEAIFEGFKRMLAPRGVLSFFEYVAVRNMKTLVAGRAERERLRQVSRIMNQTMKPARFDREMVMANLPPAWVHHVSWSRER